MGTITDTGVVQAIFFTELEWKQKHSLNTAAHDVKSIFKLRDRLMIRALKWESALEISAS